MSEPNLDKRTAGLLSNVTDPKSLVVEGGSWLFCSKSTAIYAGEIPGAHGIQNSVHIHILPTNASTHVPPSAW